MQRIIVTLLIFISTYTFAAPPIAMSYYDVGELYDTIPSPFYDDKAYTPKGKKRWTTERYIASIESVVAVIDSMKMPIVALFGVENESVVREITMRSKSDYSYIHRTQDYYDGRDFAILYYGDRLFVNHIRSDYHSLYVAGEIEGRGVDIYLTRRGDKLRSILSPIANHTPEITIVAGALDTSDLRRLNLSNPLEEHEKSGKGDTRGGRGWYFANRLAVSGDIQSSKGGVYITPWIVASTESRTTLPLYIFIE